MGITRTRRLGVCPLLHPVQPYQLLTDGIIVWDSVYGFDYTPLKLTALTEPLVDTVDIKSVVTDPCAVLTLDLYTCTAADLAFSLPFNMSIRRTDYIHALIAWFDIEFSACHKPVRFSTGPHTKYTHWKQTVFYTPETLTVSVSRSSHHPRPFHLTRMVGKRHYPRRTVLCAQCQK